MLRYSRCPFRRAAVLVAAPALAACSDTPTGAPSDAALAPSPSADFVTTGGVGSASAILVSPHQTVQVNVGDGTEHEGGFNSAMHILPSRPSGQAGGGILIFKDFDVGHQSAPEGLTFTATILNIDVTRSGDGFVAEFTGQGELCTWPAGDCRSFPITGTVQSTEVEDCLIYDLVGPDVHTRFSFEAVGKLIIPGEGPA